jgi:hypothetical protein
MSAAEKVLFAPGPQAVILSADAAHFTSGTRSSPLLHLS